MKSLLFDRRKILLLLGWLLPWFMNGQGLILNDSIYERLQRQPVYSEGSKAENELLAITPKADLRPYCPRPQSQGAIGSCTGWATGYGALSITKAIQQNWAAQTDTITKNAFSALFVYNQVKLGSCDMGAPIDAASMLLRDKGDVLSSSFDKFKNNCDRQPLPDEIKEAGKYRIKDFMTLFGINDNARIKIEKTKLSLAQKKPVIIGMLLRKNFENLTRVNPTWYPDNGDTTFWGAHAMVVVGYDDGKEAFEVMNSWGSGWGDGGFGWVKYADYARFCCYAFQFVPSDDPGANLVYNARAFFRQPFYDTEDQLLFENKDLFFNGKYYELKKGQLERNALAQLYLSYVTEGSYIYAFSVDGKKQARVHWPRDGSLDNKYEGSNESAFITVPEIRLAIPGENDALIFNTPGTEYLCLLVAREPITDLNQSLKRLQLQSSTDFSKNLYSAFGASLQAAKDIHYETDGLGFSNSIKKGKAVPIILRLRVL